MYLQQSVHVVNRMCGTVSCRLLSHMGKMHDSQRLPCATYAFLKCEGLCGQPTERRFALGQFSQQYPQKSDSIHCINDHDIHFPDVKIISAQLPVDTSIVYLIYKSS